MLSINTNLSSMIAQQSLNKSTNILNQAIERMTTGAKINHASDNAANYSIATNMTTQLNSYEVAQDNVASGMDLVSVASDSLSLMSDHASRIRDLCIQARNGTYGQQSLKAIQSEVDARIAEIVRQYNTTEYNGINLLNKVEDNIPAGMPKAGASGFIDEDFERITPDIVVSNPDELADAIANNTTIGIANAETLAKLAELVNSGTSCGGKTITLTEDIDLSAYSTGEGWTPIGNDSLAFLGTFDGQGHKVKNLYINRPTTDAQGLFGNVYNGELKNVGVENCNVTGSNCVGGIAGVCDGTITNCYAIGNVEGKNNVAAFAGMVNSITNSYVVGNIIGEFRVGGLAGFCSSLVDNCYSVSNVNGQERVGGLVGNPTSSFSMLNSYSTGNVTGTNYVGGLVGFLYESTIMNSYATGNVTGTNYVGGLIGESEFSSITNVYATGNVTGTSYVAGLSGSFYEASLTNCYAKGNVTGEGSVGGLIGLIHGTCTIMNSKSYSQSVVGGAETGSFVGCADGGSTISGCKTIEIDGLSKIGTTDIYNDGISYVKTSTTLQVGINSDSSCQITFNTDFSFGLINQLKSLKVTDESSLDFIDKFLNKISEKQTDFGAVQNRLDSALEEIGTHIENLTSSRSTLRDADIAKESSEYIRGQILQQASSTLLSTANQSPAIALTLLSGIR